MREIRVRANGLGFRCLAAGPPAGPLVLLLHGFPEGAESWASQVEALGGAGLLAVAPDLRGYGGSDSPEGEDGYGMPQLVADVEGLIGAFGRERCHLAGHDWGALIGWSVAGHRPERLLTWTALSVGHPQALADSIRDDPDQRGRSSYVQLFLQREKAEKVLAEDGASRLRAMYGVGPDPKAVPAALVEEFVTGLARPGRLTAALAYYRANIESDGRWTFPPAPGPVTVPTLFVWGAQDPALGAVAAAGTARHVAGEYRLEVLEGAGHWLQHERPAEVSRLLLGWVGGHQAG